MASDNTTHTIDISVSVRQSDRYGSGNSVVKVHNERLSFKPEMLEADLTESMADAFDEVRRQFNRYSDMQAEREAAEQS